jgi:NAD(P)-dependent dehydrogenase (short-subunit alcohol dehydrogenase family)
MPNQRALLVIQEQLKGRSVMATFGKKSTAQQVSEGINLTGKNALITGANTGLGKETTRVLALRGARVTMACRDIEKAEAARTSILQQHRGQIAPEQLDILKLDMNSLAGVRESAEQFLRWQRPLHLLINNAGIMIPMERRTADGFEAHLGINHLAHFLFTGLLMPQLIAANGARVVMVASAAMAMANLTADLHDLNWEQRDFSGMKSYGDSKLMNLLFARELNRRYSDQGIVSNALHPGVIATELARDQNKLMMIVGIVALPFMKSIAQGAATSVYVATAPAYENVGGLYFKNCNEAKPEFKGWRDDALSVALWRRSEALTSFCYGTI